MAELKQKDIFKQTVKPLIGLSPMAGFTDSLFRSACRFMGADFVITELISANGIVENWRSKRTIDLLEFVEAERPILIQLFGGRPEIIEEASRIVAGRYRPDGLNINMGCPAHKIVCQGYGSALMKDGRLAGRVVEAAIRGSGLPVSVKTRLGWDEADHLSDFSSAIEQAGASALMIHGRLYSQGYRGEADWQKIWQIKSERKIPVLGNGDVTSVAAALARIGNLDGLLIGRASLENPWLFAQVKQGLISGKATERKVPLSEKIVFWQHISEERYRKLGQRGLIELRKSLPFLLKGLPESAELKAITQKISSLEDLDRFFDLLTSRL